MSIRITGLVGLTGKYNEEIFTILSDCQINSEITFSNPAITNLHQQFIHSARAVKELCDQHGGTPADLPVPTLRAYQWMQFLGQKKWLLEHLRACHEFLIHVQTARSSLKRTRKLNRIVLKVYPSIYLYAGKRNNFEERIEIHEGFIRAPAEIKQAIVQSAFNGRSPKYTKQIKAYARHEDFILISQALSNIGTVNKLTAKGKIFDLAEIYKRINQDYFNNQLRRPRLVWSSQAAKRRLGFFEPMSGAITISRRLDRPDVDPLLVEYILYHEMLHQSLGISLVNGRRHAHTREFKQAERQFKGYQQAQILMKALHHKPY